MLKTNELIHIIFAIIVITFAVSLSKIINGAINLETSAIYLLFISLIVLVNILAKKLSSEYYEAVLETKILSFERFGFRREQYFKKPFPIGIVLPFLFAVLSYGKFLWFAVLESDIEGTSARAAKRHGIYRFTEMTDNDRAIIISSGIVANLVLAIVAYLIGTTELAKWSIYYAAFSLIPGPFGGLDGLKIFFGNKVLWFALVVITGIFLGYALFLP